MILGGRTKRKTRKINKNREMIRLRKEKAKK